MASEQGHVYRKEQKHKPRAVLRITSKVNANSSILVHRNVTLFMTSPGNKNNWKLYHVTPYLAFQYANSMKYRGRTSKMYELLFQAR